MYYFYDPYNFYRTHGKSQLFLLKHVNMTGTQARMKISIDSRQISPHYLKTQFLFFYKYT